MNAYLNSTTLLQAAMREDYAFSLYSVGERFRAAHAPGLDLSIRTRRMNEAVAWYEKAEQMKTILFRGGDYAPLWN